MKITGRHKHIINIPSLTMRLRLFLFLLILVFTMVTGIVIILLVTGTFTAGTKESKKILKSELEEASREITEQYGQLSLQAVQFSEELSVIIKEGLKGRYPTVRKLSGHPKELEALISGTYQLTYFSLLRSKCSGAFLILDTTVNPDILGADNYRTGLYIKNMEPNIINSSAPTITILRGFPSISRENSLDLHTQWAMEFDISGAPYYKDTADTAAGKPETELSKLYNWSGPLFLPGTSEEVMLCTVPIFGANNNVIGICGFEISEMLFKLSYLPNNTTYSRMSCMLSQLKEDSIDLDKAMSAGGYSVSEMQKDNIKMKLTKRQKSFTEFTQDDGKVYLGYYTPVKLYPDGSPYADQNWITAVLVPKEDIADSITQLNIIIISLLTLLAAVGVFISIVSSNKYLQPISKGISIIKSQAPDEASRTNVQEIDDLIDYLAVYKKELNRKVERDTYQISVLEQFMDKTKALSPAERSVFNLYAQGLSAREIAESMYLSINTIKTHSKHIFAKLGVATREELLLYINMLKEIGREVSSL